MNDNTKYIPHTNNRTDDLLALDPLAFVEEVQKNNDILESACIKKRYEKIIERSSVCSFCGVGCSYTVEPDRNGKDRIAPLSTLGLCIKGKTSLQTGGDQERSARLKKRKLEDDRIRAPMIRGHDGQMREVSWDEALDRAAWLFLHAREWVGPDAVAIYGNGQKTLEAIWLASLYKLVFNLPTVGANSEHCLTSAGAAHVLNFGNEASFTWKTFDEFDHCDIAILHGTNAFVTFPQAYEKIKKNSHAIKIIIDPVRSDTVSELQKHDPRTRHIQFRQGGDVMFNLAVSRVIFENGWQNDASLAAQVDTESLSSFKVFCMEPRFAPLAVAQTIALPNQDPEALADTIYEHAQLIAKPRAGYRPKLAFVSSMGINQSTGSYGFSTNLNLLLLTGNVGRKGAGSLRIAGQSNATSELMLGFNSRKLVFNLDPLQPAHRAQLSERLHLPIENIPARHGTPVAQMADDDSLYCFIFIGTQMTKNMPRVGHWARRLGRSFNIVIDSFLGEGVLEHADVLLPALTYTERTGVIQRGDRTLQLQQPLTTPPELAWSDSQILARLALKIAERLRDPDTARLNKLNADVIYRTFSQYLDDKDRLIPSKVFDHLVSVNLSLDLYCKLEDATGRQITHDALKRSAGQGIQWGGDGRYTSNYNETHTAITSDSSHPLAPKQASCKGGFPKLKHHDRQRAQLVCPPDDFIAKLSAPLPPDTISLISGRGRPGYRAIQGRARYNSGIKTLPIYGVDSRDHFVEMHPETVIMLRAAENEPVRLLSQHGAVIAKISSNDRIPVGTAFIDFVPGEVNRLTNYIEADAFTHQSFIKRTIVQVKMLRRLEADLWEAPSKKALVAAVLCIHQDWQKTFQNTVNWVKTQREAPQDIHWLPPEQLFNPRSGSELHLSEAVGAIFVFFQKFMEEATYRNTAISVLASLSNDERQQFLEILLPVIRRLDYHNVLHAILSAIVGAVTVCDDEGNETRIDLLSAHKAAVLEFKEEIVAIQLYIAIKRGIELLFNSSQNIPQKDLAFISGVAIPCAGDVPAHFMGISPAALKSATLIHTRAIGHSALIVVDKQRNRAVRINVLTGVLPKDKELGYLRGVVINRKQTANGKEHRRFFDRLGELIVDYVKVGNQNFACHGPTPFNWLEFQSKLSFSPANKSQFLNFLVQQKVSRTLAQSLRELGIIDKEKDALILEKLEHNDCTKPKEHLAFTDKKLYAGTLSERIQRVVETIIGPVLENDGGRLDILNICENTGEITVRFVGSCANCPYSLLSMEQIVKPSLMAIPGVKAINHRAKARPKELETKTSVARAVDCAATSHHDAQPVAWR